MTGNISTLSNNLATRQWHGSAFYLGIVLIFIGGSVVSSLLINAGRRRNIVGIYAYSILTEAVLMFILGWADLSLSSGWRVPLLVLGLAFLMGLQNATVTHISEARVRTTHVSGMATDLGIEIGTAIDILRGRQPRLHATDNRAKLKLHALTILTFLIGGIAGVVVYRAIGGYLLFFCAATLLIIALSGLRKATRLCARQRPDATGGVHLTGADRAQPLPAKSIEGANPMPRKSIEQRLAELDAQRSALKARLGKQERTEDTRRKVLLGALVLHRLENGRDEFSKNLQTWLQAELPGFLTRDVDKALFDDLLKEGKSDVQ